MTLARAFRKNARPLAQAQDTYKQNVIAVNVFVSSVLRSSLPTLLNKPPDWTEFVSAYEQANGDALGWVNNVLARLLDVPGEVQNFNSIISQLLQDAKSQATTLEGQPSDAVALEILNQDLASLSSELGLVTAFISGAVTNIQSFQDSLPDLAAQLQSIADDSTKAAGADQQQIDKYKARISQLQADIKGLTAALVGLGIADGIAITLGVIATIAFFPEGALSWFVLAPVVAVATTYIALDAEKIEADKAAIEQTQGEMNSLTADVATLHVLSANFAGLASQTELIETNLQAILAEWQTLEGDVNAATTDIRAATSDSGGSNFAAVLADVEDAINE